MKNDLDLKNATILPRQAGPSFSENNSSSDSEYTLGMHPQVFAMWLFMGSVVMLFAAFTSAYVVKQADGNWLQYELPKVFWYNTALLLISSITMHWSYISAKKDHLKSMKIGMLATTVFGIAFLIGQYIGWQALVDAQVYFVGNASGSFTYIFTGVHAVHLISGVIVLLVNAYRAFNDQIHSRRMVSIEICTTYWHFLDAIWVLLLVFLIVNY